MTKATTFNEVFQRLPTDMDSIKKKQVGATMAKEEHQHRADQKAEEHAGANAGLGSLKN